MSSRFLIDAARHPSSSRLLTFRGRTQPATAWAREFGINPITLFSRLDKSGWSVERALTTPTKPQREDQDGGHPDAT